MVTDLDVVTKLSGYSTALEIIEGDASLKDARYFLLELIGAEKQIRVMGFKANQLDDATDQYLETEKKIAANSDHSGSRLGQSARSLRRAYPSYFLDAGRFLSAIERLSQISGLNGWQRLWVVISVVYATLVVAFGVLFWPTPKTTWHRAEFIQRIAADIRANIAEAHSSEWHWEQAMKKTFDEATSASRAARTKDTVQLPATSKEPPASFVLESAASAVPKWRWVVSHFVWK